MKSQRSFSIRPVQFGNSSILNPATDIGKDGNGFSTTFGRVGRDVYGFGLGYYNNDYIPVGGSGASLGLSYSFGTPNSATTGSALYNGNISHTTLALNKFDTGNVAGYTYAYDQLNRLIKMNRHTPTPGAATWSNGSIIDAYKEQVSSDANGNILTYLRNGNSGSISMDNLTYKYSQGNNRLDHVNDAVSATAYVVDIDNQDTLNYRYDNIGNLKKDAAEGIDSINWTVYEKIASIDKSKNIDGTVHHTRIDYTYDPAGNRVTKSFVESAGGSDGPLLTTYYARDAQGNVMGVYIDSGGVYAENKPIYWSEQHLYGSSRLGIWEQNKSIPLSPFLTEGNIQDSIMYGSTNYELTNHLGNVLATISDKKFGHALNDTTIDYFNADVVTANDYYPGGMLMPERSYSQSMSKYRYGFNGKENDNEVKGESSQQDYGMRIYDPRLMRFLSVDPVSNKFPYLTPYQFASNSPISGIDLDGLEYYYSANGAYLGHIGESQEVWTADKIETQTVKHADGTSTVSQIAVKPQNLNINHNEFTTISNIVKQEGITNDANEYLFIAHTSNNAAKSDDVSMYSKLMTGFSSVKKVNKVPLDDNNKFNSALFARAGTISAISGAKDPTGGATLWDGTDFLAWGLKSPDGTPQNKFEEYKSINISGEIFSKFTLSNLEKYSGGCVKYGKEHYDLPASVFSDPNNKTTDGGFQYSTGAKKPTGLKATATAGRSIFWKTEK